MINKTAYTIWQEKLEWIRQRYDYLLSSKVDLEDYVARYKNERNVVSPRSRIKQYTEEMITLDNERTMIYLMKLQPKK